MVGQYGGLVLGIAAKFVLHSIQPIESRVMLATLMTSGTFRV